MQTIQSFRLLNGKLTISMYLGLLLTVPSYGQDQSGNCNSDHYKVVQPFLGEWEEYTVTDSTEVYIGRLTTTLKTDGCVLNQVFESPDGSFSYHSQGYVNPSSNIWEETYVFNSGRYSKFIWVVEGESLYTLRIGGSRQTDYLWRLKYTNIQEDEYTVVSQESKNGGVTWVSRDTTRIKRIN